MKADGQDIKGKLLMDEEQEIKIQNIFLRADENGVGEIARRLWDLKDHFNPWIYEDGWDFRSPFRDGDGRISECVALTVYPTAETARNKVIVALNADNLERLYINRPRKSIVEFIGRLQYMLERPKRKFHKDWHYVEIANSKEAYLFVKEFCWLGGY
ncbi:hypothetical protein [Kamptonema formosum]|uniref:hypothetical protein n=1 Tax=Kamptonema formosum TaxID=331992 RepID=UPI0003497C1C|nr:hypothetical protein [Oscillatoria sp. PCC 10802]